MKSQGKYRCYVEVQNMKSHRKSNVTNIPLTLKSLCFPIHRFYKIYKGYQRMQTLPTLSTVMKWLPKIGEMKIKTHEFSIL